MIAFGEPGDVGRRVGMCLTILAIGALIGPPISGAIISAHGYIADGIYAGKLDSSSTVLKISRESVIINRRCGPSFCCNHVACQMLSTPTFLGNVLTAGYVL